VHANNKHLRGIIGMGGDGLDGQFDHREQMATVPKNSTELAEMFYPTSLADNASSSSMCITV